MADLDAGSRAPGGSTLSPVAMKVVHRMILLDDRAAINGRSTAKNPWPSGGH